MAHGSCGKSSSEAFDHWIHSDEVVTLEEEGRSREMTREKAIEYLKSADVTVGREIKTKTAEALEMAIKALEDGRWIPVTERLPEEEGCYLVATTGTYNDVIDIARYVQGIWHKASRIKAWMPLPRPYEEGAEE